MSGEEEDLLLAQQPGLLVVGAGLEEDVWLEVMQDFLREDREGLFVVVEAMKRHECQ